MTVGFTVVTENSVTKKISKSEGKLWLKGENFKYTFGGEQIFCNGKIQWTYNEEINEVTIEKYKKNENSISPSNIFSLYQKGFHAKYDGLSSISGVQYEGIVLTPKDKKNKYYQIEMLINKSTSRIKKMKVYYKNGYRITYLVNSFKPNNPLSTKFFEFDKSNFPEVVEVNLR
jgi:outer membrane lipoprotein-sorting protein